MRVLGLVLAAAIVCSSTAVRGQTFTKFGEGTSSCGEWTHLHSSSSARSAVQNSWLLGFLTAASLYRQDGPNFSENVDSAAVIAWVSNYCRQNPLDDVTKAASTLTHELRRRASN